MYIHIYLVCPSISNGPHSHRSGITLSDSTPTHIKQSGIKLS